MLKVSSGWSSRSRPGQREPVGQRRDKAEAGLALGGGVSGEQLSWRSRREPARRRSFCMLDMM